jgi:hypothetical protein
LERCRSAQGSTASYFTTGSGLKISPDKWLLYVANSYLPGPDGRRFLINMALDTTPSIRIVTHWTAGLKE